VATSGFSAGNCEDRHKILTSTFLLVIANVSSRRSLRLHPLALERKVLLPKRENFRTFPPPLLSHSLSARAHGFRPSAVFSSPVAASAERTSVASETGYEPERREEERQRYSLSKSARVTEHDKASLEGNVDDAQFRPLVDCFSIVIIESQIWSGE